MAPGGMARTGAGGVTANVVPAMAQTASVPKPAAMMLRFIESPPKRSAPADDARPRTGSRGVGKLSL
jgi:hypothetical protein